MDQNYVADREAKIQKHIQDTTEFLRGLNEKVQFDKAKEKIDKKDLNSLDFNDDNDFVKLNQYISGKDVSINNNNKSKPKSPIKTNSKSTTENKANALTERHFEYALKKKDRVRSNSEIKMIEI